MALPGHIVWKLLKMSHLHLGILAFSTNFCPVKIDLSGNTVWPQASGFQNLAKMDLFWHLELTFDHSNCKRSLLRSQCWMRLFLWLSNTVLHLGIALHLMSPVKCRSTKATFIYCTTKVDTRGDTWKNPRHASIWHSHSNSNVENPINIISMCLSHV